MSLSIPSLVLIKYSIWAKSLKDEEPGSEKTFADEVIPPASQVLGLDFPVSKTLTGRHNCWRYWPFKHSYPVCS